MGFLVDLCHFPKTRKSIKMFCLNITKGRVISYFSYSSKEFMIFHEFEELGTSAWKKFEFDKINYVDISRIGGSFLEI